MKLKCDNCGEIIESGIANVMEHTFDNCKAINTEKVNDMFSIKTMPFTNVTPLQDWESHTEGSLGTSNLFL